MRRSEKEINDIGVIEEILRKAPVCRLGLCEGDRPYVIPVCFGYKDNALYFHCAGQGKKLDIIRKNSNVCFEVDTDCEIIKAEKACEWGMRYKSIVGFGKASLIEDIELKRKAFDIIMRKFSGGEFEYSEEALKNPVVVKVEIESMRGKQSG